MTIPQGPLNDLLPEIYPIIASHLPLHETPSTLLALALTNHHISKIVLPLLHSRLVLKNETDATQVLQKLVDNPSFGRFVRELHIRSDLSSYTWSQDPPSDVIRRVEDVIKKGYLPFIHTLGLHLMNGWYVNTEDFLAKGFGYLRKEFLVQLKQKCPRLRGLILKGFTHYSVKPWLATWGVLQIYNITSLTICFRGSTMDPSSSDKLLKHVSSLASSLHTLVLCPGFLSPNSTSTYPIFKIDMPFLRSLSLAYFREVDTALAMDFFERHPSIEYLNVAVNYIDNYWFASELPQKFLPNLRHLRVHWNDVRFLAPIMDQLISLSIHKSVNAQIPYLLRSILPNGLPKLKSLGIGQAPRSSKRKNNTDDGSLWFESEDGTFQQLKTPNTSRTVFDSFMHSIVRAAPVLEELGFYGARLELSKFVSIADDLNGFPHLKRLYYRGNYYSWRSLSREERNILTAHARALAEAVLGLESITLLGNPFWTARITRRKSGEVTGVELGQGCGMQIGHDDEAFPCLPYNGSDSL